MALHEKPRAQATEGERRKYAPLVNAVAAACEEVNCFRVPTRMVYERLDWNDGGGFTGQPGWQASRRNGYTESQRMPRLVRRLKQAAMLDLIDGYRVGQGFEWAQRADVPASPSWRQRPSGG